MKYKLIKETVAIIGAFAIMTNCMTTAFAVNANIEEFSEINAHTTVSNVQDEFRPGAVLVSFNQGAIPSIDKLLPGFEIVGSRYISPNVCMITFTDKSTDAVLKAVEILNASPYVKCAEPDYYMSIQPVIKPTSEPTETTEPTTVSNVQDEFRPGAVLVSFNQGAIPSIDKLLPGFEIVGSRYISPNVYMITFTDKSTDAVLKAVEILNASPYVKCAEPDYYMSIQPVIKPTSEPTESSQSDTQSSTEEPVQLLKGDADGDGRLTIRDATCIQRYLAQIISDDEINISAATVSGRNNVSITDATMIQRKLVGLVDEW